MGWGTRGVGWGRTGGTGPIKDIKALVHFAEWTKFKHQTRLDLETILWGRQGDRCTRVQSSREARVTSGMVESSGCLARPAILSEIYPGFLEVFSQVQPNVSLMGKIFQKQMSNSHVHPLFIAIKLWI